MVSHLLNKYFTSAHLSLKAHSHHQSAIMSFLFLSSYLCLSYLHDLLFTVSLPLQTALLNSDLCFWDLYVWAPVPCKPPRAKQKKKVKIPLCSSSPQWPWQHRDPFHSTSFWLGIQVTDCLFGPQGNVMCKKMWIHFWQPTTCAWHNVPPFWAGFGLESEISADSSSPGKLYINRIPVAFMESGYSPDVLIRQHKFRTGLDQFSTCWISLSTQCLALSTWCTLALEWAFPC